MALENNLEIDIERTNRSTAETNVQAARGFFDPAFRWTPLMQTTNTPTGSVLQGSSGKLTDRGFVNNLSLRQNLTIGEPRSTSISTTLARQPPIRSVRSVRFSVRASCSGSASRSLRGRTIDQQRAQLLISQETGERIEHRS